MQQRLKFFENRMLRKIFGPKRDEVYRERRRLCNMEIYGFYSSPKVILVTKCRRMRRVGHMGDRRGANYFGGKTCGIETTWKT
jgi:hypothetical protein